MIEIQKWSDYRDANFSKWEAFCWADVSIDGSTCRVAFVVGVPEQLAGSAVASGCPTQFVTAWWSDYGDWSELADRDIADRVLAELQACSADMWEQIEFDREDRRLRRNAAEMDGAQ